MAITDKARKLLWGRAGARCALCRCNLVMNATADDPESVLGDEAHIYAQHEGGPRWNPHLSKILVDAYENLILLCKVHHKIADDQPEKYTAEYLKRLKTQHEAWVDSNLQVQQTNFASNVTFRVDNGTDIMRIIGGAYGCDFQHDELKTEEEVEVVGNFLQELEDYGDIYSEMAASEKTKCTFYISQQMKELDRLEFVAFVGEYTKKYQVPDGVMNFPIAVIRVVRKTNPAIQTIKSDDFHV